MRDTKLKMFGHVKRRSLDAPVRRCERINILEDTRLRGRLKKSLNKVIR